MKFKFRLSVCLRDGKGFLLRNNESYLTLHDKKPTEAQCLAAIKNCDMFKDVEYLVVRDVSWGCNDYNIMSKDGETLLGWLDLDPLERVDG